MGKYISKRKKKKVWKPMHTLPINKQVWLVLKPIENRPDLNNRKIIGTTCNSWTENMIRANGTITSKDNFDAWCELKIPIDFH